MSSNITRIDDSAKGKGPQGVAAKRKRRDLEPQFPSIRAAIFGLWLNGELDRRLADKYGCRVEFIHAICRAEARAMREQLREARIGRAA